MIIVFNSYFLRSMVWKLSKHWPEKKKNSLNERTQREDTSFKSRNEELFVSHLLSLEGSVCRAAVSLLGTYRTHTCLVALPRWLQHVPSDLFLNSLWGKGEPNEMYCNSLILCYRGWDGNGICSGAASLTSLAKSGHLHGYWSNRRAGFPKATLL